MGKKILTIFAIAIISAGGIGFYGGMRYGQSKGFGSFQNLTQEQRQQRMQQMGGAGIRNGGTAGVRGDGGGFFSGEIISKDDKSVTVKMSDGGSKIVFYSGSTQIGEFTTGNADNLEIGKSVGVNGQANSDGSITAQSIQIRPRGTSFPLQK